MYCSTEWTCGRCEGGQELEEQGGGQQEEGQEEVGAGKTMW